MLEGQAQVRLSAEQEQLLRALATGSTLKAQRTLDGVKRYQLRALDQTSVEIAAHLVEGLCRQRLLQSNLKFPAAVYLLTDQGLALARGLVDWPLHPVGPKNFD
jgi:hypothetical protein